MGQEMKKIVMLLLLAMGTFIQIRDAKAVDSLKGVAGDRTDGKVFIQHDGKREEMDYKTAVVVKLSIFSDQHALLTDGVAAELRITDKKPILYVNKRPEDFAIVRLIADTYNEKPVRHIVKQGYLPVGMDDGRSGVIEKFKVDSAYKKDGAGLYRVWPKQPLEKGEYALVIGTSDMMNTYARFQFFDFGVD